MNPEQNPPPAAPQPTTPQPPSGTYQTPAQPASNPMPYQAITPDSLTPQGKRLYGMMECDDQEHILCEIRKHPFGLVVIYLSGIVPAAVLLALTIGAYYAAGSFLSDSGGGSRLLQIIIVVIGLLLIGFIMLAAAIRDYIYRNSTILVTTQKISQMVYKSLFRREITQLSLGHIEDVSVEQRDIFSRMFHYGTLEVQTAGEKENITFSFVPDPYTCAKDIVAAHERDIEQHGN